MAPSDLHFSSTHSCRRGCRTRRSAVHPHEVQIRSWFPCKERRDRFSRLVPHAHVPQQPPLLAFSWRQPATGWNCPFKLDSPTTASTAAAEANPAWSRGTAMSWAWRLCGLPLPYRQLLLCRHQASTSRVVPAREPADGLVSFLCRRSSFRACSLQVNRMFFFLINTSPDFIHTVAPHC